MIVQREIVGSGAEEKAERGITRHHENTCTHVFPKADNNLIFEASHEGEPIENTHTHTLSTCRSAASFFKSNQSSELETNAF